MAKARLLSKSLSTSEKFTNLKTDSARLLYCLLHPHSDDFGRLDGTPFWIKHNLVPTLEKFTQKQVKDCLSDMNNEKIIEWYKIDGRPYIQIVDFEKHQTGLHKRTKPKIPGNSGKFREIPSEGKGIEGNLKEKPFVQDDETDHPEPDVKISFNWETSKIENVKKTQVKIWSEAYPACDVSAEIRKAAAWQAANPKKRKKDYKRFLNNWLSRCQEKGGTQTKSDTWGAPDMEIV